MHVIEEEDTCMSRHRPKKNFWVKFWVMFFEMHSVLCHFFFNLKNDTKKIKTECIQCFCVIWRDLWLVAVLLGKLMLV